MMSIARAMLLLCACLSPAVLAQDVPETAEASPSRMEPAPSAQAPADALFVLPGDFLSERTTVAELQARFGADNVRLAIDGQAGAADATLYPDDPTRRAYLTFHDNGGIAHVLVDDRDTRWRGKHGVRIGMSLAELRQANGKAFYYTGFDAQGRGYVSDQWSPALDDDDATLGALDVGENEWMYFGVVLGLRAGATPPTAWPHDEPVSSDDPRYPRLGTLVEVTALEARTSLDDEW